MSENNTAVLSNANGYTVFQFNKHIIRFQAPFSLEYYTEIKQWDHGYLVVMAKYRHNAVAEEDYIDLIPILEDLYFDADEFLTPIKGVQIAYDRYQKSC